MRRLTFWHVALAGLFLCVLLMNVFSIPAHDELAYAFMGESTPIDGTCPRVSSLSDIMRQQRLDYLHAMGGGRIFVHGLVAMFSGFRLYYAYDFLNSCAWFLFVFLIMKEANVRMNAKRLVVGSLVVFMFWWYSENACMNAAFATNYLWMACATILVFRLWRNLRSWLWMPVAFLFGWGQESFSLPATAALVAAVMLRSVIERRYAATAKQSVFLALMASGAIGLVMSPGIRNRADSSLDFLSPEFLVSVAKWTGGIAFSIWPVVLLVLVANVLWSFRGNVGRLYEDMEWWLFFVAALAMSALLCSCGPFRLLSGWCMAGLVLVLRDRPSGFLESRPVRWFAVVAAVWMFSATCLQVSYGLENFRMLERYRSDKQGVTFRQFLPPTLFYATCDVGRFVPWHLHLFALEFGKDVSPAIFSAKMYRSLYEEPQKFFATSRCDGDVYLSCAIPGLLVKKGECDFSDDELRRFKATQETGWCRLLPGRLRWMFPSETKYAILPYNPFTFTAKDGNPYTVCLLHQPICRKTLGGSQQ